MAGTDKRLKNRELLLLGADALKHVFTRTERGKGEAREIARSHPEEAKIVRRTVNSIKRAVPGFRQRTLSAAAKIHLIVSEQGQPVQLDQLNRLAGGLGW